MSIPIITIPEQGKIATRPRREQVYDTEFYASGSAVAAKIQPFTNQAGFASTGTAAIGGKKKPRDTNMEVDSMLPQGQMFHFYGLCLPYWAIASMQASANLIVLDEMRILRETSVLSFRFGSRNIFFQAQCWHVPAGVARCYPFTTENAQTVVGESMAVDRRQTYDVTLNGVPTELLPLESFGLDVETFTNTQPTPTADIYVTPVLKGVLFKGIQG